MRNHKPTTTYVPKVKPILKIYYYDKHVGLQFVLYPFERLDSRLLHCFGHALFTLCFDFSRRLKRAGQTFSVALDFLAANSNGPYGESKAFVFKIISLL